MSDCISTGRKADAMMKQIVDLRAERDALRKDIERLRVQLAGCSVIAGSNTKRSITQAMPSSDAYGYSAALADVERCVRREIDLRAERDDFYSDYRMKCDKETKALTVERDALRYDIERHCLYCGQSGNGDRWAANAAAEIPQ
ncbi:MAG: hypothetical protein IPN24_11265 [Betaproteobacteria bacterium]|nr:hypothetical protein [Betaproteobacteria bacterium]